MDILVNNACAATLSRPFLEQTVDDLMLPINTGLIPTWMMMQLCFPLMKERGGSIINLGSGSEEGLAGFSAYGSIKSAISALTRTVAIEFGSYNIRVNNVYPTGLTEKMTGALDREVSKEALDYIVSGMAQNALKRAGDPYKDVSPVFLFLASDDSSYVTGQGLYVDGGAVIHR